MNLPLKRLNCGNNIYCAGTVVCLAHADHCTDLRCMTASSTVLAAI